METIQRSASPVGHHVCEISFSEQKGDHSSSEGSPVIKADSDDGDTESSPMSGQYCLDQHASTFEQVESKQTPACKPKLPLVHGRNVQEGRYYCKYCENSWPLHHFRNAQQFGAHCSNCSRKRKVKDPQQVTTRELNKRARRNSEHKRRKAGGSKKRRRRTQSAKTRFHNVEESRYSDSGRSTKAVAKTKGRKAAVNAKPSMSNLVQAVETTLTEEHQRVELHCMKSALLEMQEQVRALRETHVSALRYQLASTFQELRLELLGSVEALRVDLSSEVASVEKSISKDTQRLSRQMEELKGIIDAERDQRRALSQPTSVTPAIPLVTTPKSGELLYESVHQACSSYLAQASQDLQLKLSAQEEKLQHQLNLLQNQMSGHDPVAKQAPRSHQATSAVAPTTAAAIRPLGSTLS